MEKNMIILDGLMFYRSVEKTCHEISMSPSTYTILFWPIASSQMLKILPIWKTLQIWELVFLVIWRSGTELKYNSYKRISRVSIKKKK